MAIWTSWTEHLSSTRIAQPWKRSLSYTLIYVYVNVWHSWFERWHHRSESESMASSIVDSGRRKLKGKPSEWWTLPSHVQIPGRGKNTSVCNNLYISRVDRGPSEDPRTSGGRMDYISRNLEIKRSRIVSSGGQLKMFDSIGQYSANGLLWKIW